MVFPYAFSEADLFLAPLSCQLKRGAWAVPTPLGLCDMHAQDAGHCIERRIPVNLSAAAIFCQNEWRLIFVVVARKEAATEDLIDHRCQIHTNACEVGWKKNTIRSGYAS